MADDLLNILSNSNKDIDNQKLMDYLSGKLNAQERHEVEKVMAENEFLNEAVEGLQEVKPGQDIQTYTDQLNKQLNQYIAQRKVRREKRAIKHSPFAYLAVIIILALVVIVYLILHKLQH